MTHLSLVELARAFWQTNPMDWRYNAEIVTDYMPPYPREDTRPSTIIRYPTCDTDKDGVTRYQWLRHSCGPRQGFSWDCYGDDMHNVALAFKALCEAPTPPHLWMPQDYDLSIKLLGNHEKAVDKHRSPRIIRYHT